MTKFVASMIAFAMIFSVSGRAMATRYTPQHHSNPSTEISIVNHDTEVVNVAGSLANTGLSSQSGSWFGHQTMSTGAVVGVSSVAHSEVNSSMFPACTSCSLGKVSIKNEHTSLVNAAVSVANTGVNKQSAGMMTHQSMGTGAVTSVGSNATSLVNYTDFSVK